MVDSLKQKALDNTALVCSDCYFSDWDSFKKEPVDTKDIEIAVEITLRVVFDFCEQKEKELNLTIDFEKIMNAKTFLLGLKEAFKTIKEKCK